MKNVFIFASFLFFGTFFTSSCVEKAKEINVKNCIILSCEEIKRSSVHDEINPISYRLKTDCNAVIISREKYSVGDTIQIKIYKYK